VAKRHERQAARSTLGLILRQRDLVGAINPETFKRTPSSLQQVLLVHHNTQALIEGFRAAYRFLDPKYFKDRPDSVAYLDHVIRAVFTSDEPFTVIDDCAVMLDALSYEGVFGK